MKEFLTRYSHYNAWANETLLTEILGLTPEQQQQEIISSFRSIYKTVLHVLNAETVWLQRFYVTVNTDWMGDPFVNDMNQLAAALHGIDEQWNQFTTTIPEELVTEVLDYKNIKGESFSFPRDLLMHHIFNHSTYHRGQLVTMLRQVGLEKLPSTDFSTWIRYHYKKE